MFSCPFCNGKTGVLVTFGEWRKRKCKECDRIFHTVEIEEAWTEPKAMTSHKRQSVLK